VALRGRPPPWPAYAGPWPAVANRGQSWPAVALLGRSWPAAVVRLRPQPSSAAAAPSRPAGAAYARRPRTRRRRVPTRRNNHHTGAPCRAAPRSGRVAITTAVHSIFQEEERRATGPSQGQGSAGRDRHAYLCCRCRAGQQQQAPARKDSKAVIISRSARFGKPSGRRDSLLHHLFVRSRLLLLT
jgi:hypothetical protein